MEKYSFLRFVRIGTKGLGVRNQRLLNCREAATTPEWRATNPLSCWGIVYQWDEGLRWR